MRIVCALMLLAAATVSAAQSRDEVTPGEIAAVRKGWTLGKLDNMGMVQPVFGRVISISIPKGFVPGFRSQTRGFYIMEYIPDGETVASWTRMVTITGTLGMGAAHVEDAEIADLQFNKLGCQGRLYRDLGSVDSPTTARRRTVVIGCDALRDHEYDQVAKRASERNAIAFLRDDQSVWTVQYAERSTTGKPLFDPSEAPALLDKLKILACAPEDLLPKCRQAMQLSNYLAAKQKQ